MFFSTEAMDLQASFESLTTAFSIRTISSFLEASWLCDSFDAVERFSLSRLVYSYGDQNEVYTQFERNFIPTIDDVVLIQNGSRQIRGKNISCAIIAVDLSCSRDVLYDGLFAMKVINKAIGGYNLFVLVGDEQILLGSTQTTVSTDIDCQIAFPIRYGINWEYLGNLLLYRSDEGDFASYYHGISALLASVILCYDQNDSTDRLSLANSNAFYTWNQLQDWGQELYRDECEGQELYEEYLKAVDDIQHQLSGIKPIKVNALEMLFDAEQAEMESTEADTITKEAISNEDYDVPEEDEHIAALLEDPIALLKQLKKQSKNE